MRIGRGSTSVKADLSTTYLPRNAKANDREHILLLEDPSRDMHDNPIQTVSLPRAARMHHNWDNGPRLLTPPLIHHRLL